MKALSVLSRLNPGVIGFRDKIDHAHSVPGFTVSDAAAALGGIPTGAVVLLQMIYTGGHDTPDRVMRRWAEGFIAEKVRGRSADRVFRDATDDDLRRVTDSVVYDLISPCLCPACLGRGGQMRGNLKVTCETCKGKGAGRVPDKVLRRVSGFSHFPWYRRWRKVHEVVKRDMESYLMHVKGRIEARSS